MFGKEQFFGEFCLMLKTILVYFVDFLAVFLSGGEIFIHYTKEFFFFFKV